MYATTIDELYEAVERRGGLTARVKLEELVSLLHAAADVAPQSERRDTIPSPAAPTVPLRMAVRP